MIVNMPGDNGEMEHWIRDEEDPDKPLRRETEEERNKRLKEELNQRAAMWEEGADPRP